MSNTGVYTFHFELVGSIEIEANDINEAWDLFNEIDDYSEYVNSSDAFNTIVEE